MKLRKFIATTIHEYLNENIKNIKTIHFDELYHGTTKDRFEDISKNGFSIKKQGEKSGYGSVLGVSMTSNIEIAKEHAEWAVEKFGGEKYVITINSKSLKILSGGDFARIDNDYNEAFILYKNGLIDGVELCDMETGDGCEEFEVFIFNINKLNKSLREFSNEEKLYESIEINRNYVNNFLNDFGFFITLNLSQVTKNGIDLNSTEELNNMMRNLRKPIINNLNYVELTKDTNILYSKPKLLSELLNKIREFLIYIEPRISRFVKVGEYKTKWLEKIEDLKSRYKNIISK